MGQEASKPERGKSLMVIGAGLPRTGTASLSQALQILLKGPIYHEGTQHTMSEEKNILGWIDILRRTPIQSEADRQYIYAKLRELLDGYVAITDTPAHLFVEELMALYPNAKVICTVRDPETWAKSMDKVGSTSLQTMLGFFLFWLPTLRYLPRYLEAVNSGRWSELYGPPAGREKYVHGRRVWERHMAYLERTVPTEKLSFIEVGYGWEPLCKALNLPVPKSTPFPRINDGQAAEDFAKRHIQRGITRWLVVMALLVCLVASGVRILKYSWW